MKKIDFETLKTLLVTNDCPILLEELPNELYEDAVILSHDCDVSLLNGHYEDVEFLPPEWYTILERKCNQKHSLLILNQVNRLPKIEQLKFLEILKYHKISTFELPKNCSIIVVASNLEKYPLIEEIYSLVAKV